MSNLHLGIDVGTTATKVAVVDESGVSLGRGHVTYSVTSSGPGLYVQDAREWQQAVIAASRAATQGVDRSLIRALAITAQGGTLVPVDAGNRPLAPARSWLDRRAVEEAAELRRAFGARGVFERTGWPIGPNNTCAQILAFRREQPDLFGHVRFFLDTASYLNHWLAGTPVIDTNIAGITQLTNVLTGAWDTDVLDLLTITPDRLPKLARPGQPIGILSPSAREDLGLPASTLVVAGGHDQYCAALGSGVVAVGDMLLSAGTAWVLLAIAADMLHQPGAGFSFGRHLIPGLWGHFGEVTNGGVCIEWIRRLWTPDQRADSLGSGNLESIVSGTPAGADGAMFFPHFDGTSPYGAQAASQGTFLGLRLAHGRGHLTRAIMEGIAIQAAALLASYQGQAGRHSGLTVTGGATKSPTWTRIIAGVFGEIKIVDRADAACSGAAMLAAAGAGEIGSIEDASRQMAPPRVPMSADRAERAAYADLSGEYELCARRLGHLYDDLRSLTARSALTGR